MMTLLARPVIVLVAAALLAAGCAGTVASHQVPVRGGPRPATLTGDVYRPNGPGPFPAVILLHGCSGVRPNSVAWAEWLRSEGYVALLLDSFSGRGLRNLCGGSAALMGGPRAHDVFRAAESLKALSFVDAGRIGAIGFSHGGWTVLWTGVWENSYPQHPVKALVAFYPFCGDVGTYSGSVPLLMLLGARDDWTPAAPCQAIAESARQSGRRVSAMVYPEAHHAFDAANLARPTRIPEARGGRGATVAYDPQAHGDSIRQVRQFLAEHLRR
jgi:dienelactone hydrolase